MSGFRPNLRNFFLSSSFIQHQDLWFKIKSNRTYFSGTILDFGCGEKPYLELLCAKRHIGVDIVSSNNQIADVLYEQLPLDFENDTFDSILCTQVLYQIEDDEAVLSEFYRCLKDDGILLLSVPFIWFDADGSLQRRYSKCVLERKLIRANFEIIEHWQTVGHLGIFPLLFRKYIESLEEPSIKKSWITYLISLVARIILNFLCNSFGILFSVFSRKKSDLYIDNLIIAKKSALLVKHRKN